MKSTFGLFREIIITVTQKLCVELINEEYSNVHSFLRYILKIMVLMMSKLASEHYAD